MGVKGKKVGSTITKYVPDIKLNCEKVDLYEHNKDTYERMLDLLAKSDKVAVVQATGTGKSFIFMKYIQECILNNPIYSETVCGSSRLPAIGKIVVVVPNDSLRVGYKSYKEWDSRVDVITYQKLVSMYSGSTKSSLGVTKCSVLDGYIKDVNLVIFDEMHRMGAEKWGEACQYVMDKILSKSEKMRVKFKDDIRASKINVESYNSKLIYLCGKVIGLTATPIRDLDNNKNTVEELFDGIYVQGPDLKVAIKKGILPSFSYNILLRGNSLDKVKEKVIKAKNAMKSEKYIGDKLKRMQDSINKIEMSVENCKVIEESLRSTLSKKENQKWIVFCANTEELNEVDIELKSWFSCVSNNIKIYKMLSNDGENSISKKDNMNELQQFMDAKSGICILKVINMLNEGVHVKNVDGAILMRGTKSRIMYLQQIGRVLSASHKGDKPIIIDFMCNYLNLREKCTTEKSKNDLFRENMWTTRDVVGLLGNKATDDVNGIGVIEIFKEYSDLDKELQSSRKWTPEEEGIVLRNENNTNQSYIELKKIGNNRTQDAVKAKWRELAKANGLYYDTGNRITPEEMRNMLYKHIALGESCEKIASDMNCDVGRVSNYLNRNGVNKDIKTRGLTAEQFADLIHLRMVSGYSWSRLADKYGVSDSTIKNLFKKAGMSDDDVSEFGKKGLKLTDVQIRFMKDCIGSKRETYGSQILGISLMVLREYFKKHGIEWAGNSDKVSIDISGLRNKDLIKHSTEVLYYGNTKVTVRDREKFLKLYERCNCDMGAWLKSLQKLGIELNVQQGIKLLRDCNIFRNRQSYETLCKIYSSYTNNRNLVRDKDELIKYMASGLKIQKQTLMKVLGELGLEGA